MTTEHLVAYTRIDDTAVFTYADPERHPGLYVTIVTGADGQLRNASFRGTDLTTRNLRRVRLDHYLRLAASLGEEFRVEYVYTTPEKG